MPGESTVDVLNGLLQSLHDGRSAYAIAADNATSPELAAYFNLASATRGELIAELVETIRRFSGEPAALGTAGGLLERAWIDVKGALGSDDLGVLNAIERCDESLVGAYEKALETELPASVRELLVGQLSAVRDSRDRVRELRDDFRSARG